MQTDECSEELMSVHLDCNTWFICDLEKERRLDYVNRHPGKSFSELYALFTSWKQEKCTGWRRRLEWCVRVPPCEACKKQASAGYLEIF